MIKLLLNIIWAVFFGFWTALIYLIGGCIFYITIIGIPFGRQCFKYSKLVFFPFGKKVQLRPLKHPIANVIWAIFFGWELLLVSLTSTLIFGITIIGIPFALQTLKIGIFSFLPFGSKING